MDDLIVKKEGEFSYPICFRNDFDSLSDAFSAAGYPDRKICVIADSNTSRLYLQQVLDELKKISASVTFCVIPAGEENKKLETISGIYRQLVAFGLDRKSVLAALGGGITGDMTGFAAATYMRGIDFVQIPTTLLSQVDASVGGKTGVDFEQYKNMVGAFHQPSLVYMNMKTLTTLPPEEFAGGMAEVLKTGLICDEAFFRRTCADREKLQNYDSDRLSGMVRRCCEIKAQIVGRDPFEHGERALLNLGHTIGHAVEKLMDFRMIHGHCVAVGLHAAAVISRNRGFLSREECEEIRQALISFGLPVTTEGLDREEVLHAARKDKKAENGRMRFILMKRFGEACIASDVSDEEILNALKEVVL